LNVPGLLVPFQLLIYPRLVVPALVVKDIRHIDFPALKLAGYRGAVFDKDNCLTLPHRDTLIPELQKSWEICRETFGQGNVLIVSNSAGTWLDAGGIQSESVTHHLKVPVLCHKAFKPAYSCITAIRSYFSSLQSPILDHELIIVGDRIFTDVLIANRMRMQSIRKQQTLLGSSLASTSEKVEKAAIVEAPKRESTAGPLAIWTTGIWERETMPMRWMERSLVSTVERWSTPPTEEPIDVRRFLKKEQEIEPPKKSSILVALLSRLKRT